jgi:hypothetical protein
MNWKPNELEQLQKKILERIAQIGPPTEAFDSPKIQEMLRQHQHSNRIDEYYYAVDITQFKIIWSHGIDLWLKHPIEQHHFNFHVGLVHPFIRRWYIYFAIGIYELLYNNPDLFQTHPQLRFVINLPIRNAKGSYTCVKQIGIPLQLDHQNRMVSHFNIHQVMDGYRGHPLRPRIFDGNTPCHDLEKKLLSEVAELVTLKPEEQLTNLELKTLQLCYKYRVHHDRKNKIEEELGRHMRSVDGYRSAINKKMRILMDLSDESKTYYRKEADKLLKTTGHQSNIFSGLPRFEDAYDIAFFLGKSGIIDIMEQYLHKKIT